MNVCNFPLLQADCTKICTHQIASVGYCHIQPQSLSDGYKSLPSKRHCGISVLRLTLFFLNHRD